MPRSHPLFLAAAIAALALTACRPGGPRAQDADTWRWVYSTGGIGGRTVTPEAQNLRVVYQFRRDSVLAIYRDPGGQDTVRYRIRAGAAPDGRDLIYYSRPVSVLAPTDSIQYLRRIGRDTLRLADRCADCYEHTFVRVR